MKKKITSKTSRGLPIKEFKKVHNRHNIHFKLLVSDVDFHEDILKLRSDLNIPKEGFEITEIYEGSDLEKWYEEFYRKSNDVTASKNFRYQIHRIHDNKKEVGEEMSEKQYKLIHEEIPINYLSYNLDYIIDKYHLPLNYKEPLQTYLLSNKIFAPTKSFTGGAYPLKDTDYLGAREIRMSFYSKLTDEDLIELKYYVNNIIGKHLPEIKPMKDVDNKLTFEDWMLNKRNVKNEGDDIEYTLSAKEILKNTKLKAKPQQVYDSVRELRKQRIKRFGKR